MCHSFSSKEQASFNFMTVVTIHNDFGSQENKTCHCFHFCPSITHEVMGPDAVILAFWMLSFKPAFFLSSFPVVKRLISSFPLSAVRVVSSAYLGLLVFLLTILFLCLYISNWNLCSRSFLSLNHKGHTFFSFLAAPCTLGDLCWIPGPQRWRHRILAPGQLGSSRGHTVLKMPFLFNDTATFLEQYMVFPYKFYLL